MNVKKQQMQLQLQLQQPQRRHDRTGFETLLDQPMPVAETSPPGGTLPWSTAVASDTASRYDHPLGRRGPPATIAGLSDVSSDHTGSPAEADDATAAVTAARPGRPQDQAVTTPPPPSPLQLPSPYYDRNPVIGFPVHHHHHHHHHLVPKSPTNATTSVPLANVQNVGYATGDQDHNDHYANRSKYYYQRHNYKSGDLTDGRDDDKENIKQRDTAECLQQQLDEVLQACADYEERNKNQQQPQSESSGNTSPGTATTSTTTPPQQNRIKTNGSLPRDSKKSATETSSPTSPLSPMTSPLSPSSTTWPSVTTPSSPTMSPLSLRTVGGDSDSVFLENDNHPPSPAVCGSPRTRIRTLVPSCATANEELHYSSGGKNQLGQTHNGQHSTDIGLKTSPTTADYFPSKSADQPLQQMQLQSLQSTFLQSSPPPSWQTTTMWLRSSPFATDPKDGGSTKAPTVSFAAADRLAEAAEQRRKLLVELSAHKSRLVELHLRREEVDRELIIETALLRAELDAADDETRQSDNIVDGLDRAVADCRQKMDACTVKQQDQRIAADSQLAGHRQTLQGLRKRLESIEDNDVLKTEIRASIDKQTELLDAEQKLYEDVEFGLLEEEAGWLARREELHRDRAAAVAVRRARRARAEWLRAQLDQLRSVGDDQLRALRADINTATLSIQQGHKKLQELDAAAASTTAATNIISDQYHRPHQFHKEMHSMQSAAEHQPPKSLEWSWDQHIKSPMSPRTPSSLSWDLQPSRSPWFSTATPVTEDTAANNINSLMNGSMTTTCCSSIGSSGGEDDGCARPVSDDSISRMSMSTIFDGGATIKLRPKNKTSPSDITKRPLTRYLPIRYDDDGSTENPVAFDLRAHIESAGHQLDDDNNAGVDRHFWIDSTSCRGYLKKLSGSSGNNNARRSGRKWLKRWFVFDRQSRTLSYYRRQSDAANQRAGAAAAEKKTVPRVSIRFQDIQEVYVDHTNSIKGQGCAFVVKTAQRTFYLSAATGQAVRVWVDVIFTGAEGYQEYRKASTVNGGQ
ncbi:mediator of RNA polymerase II transcription subunit 12 [Melanaphis sacchari]|nr:mediator of RNA polymerase II transcription subunit 12 [Melanaphis sacchari]